MKSFTHSFEAKIDSTSVMESGIVGKLRADPARLDDGTPQGRWFFLGTDLAITAFSHMSNDQIELKGLSSDDLGRKVRVTVTVEPI